ncbi:MAG: ribosome maturation factor RimP [Bacteroidota bacterium]
MITEGIRSRLRMLIEPLVQSSGAFLVDLVFRGEQGGGRVLEVFVDTDEGVSTDRCAEISRDISTTLDRENIIIGRYYVVVSSPGLDRPLKYQRQYRRHIGRPLSVRYTDQSMTRNVEGELQAVSDEWIILRKSVEDPTRREHEALRIPFDSIAEAKVKLSS